MERFFSKLDLRDIKIGTDASFPPDEGSQATRQEQGGVAKQPARRSEILKVSARSRPSAVAGAIAGVVRECGRAEVQAIGAGAANQAVKAVAIARGYLLESGIDAVCLPSFINVTINNEDRTAIRLIVEPR
ncbi:stage V sporulation protein S [Thermorudis peleae]|uniref:stage V sporulation protein S n=1 Tax=Thermorudis peleae TaxID=1382356 RepID=UPI0009DF09B0|nr:stage V sporulation protein S [Thermorudis peleae]MBX6753262.1 stage V sporulation protein S [Thermorudis peleae]